MAIALQQPLVMSAASSLTASVLQRDDVENAASSTVTGVLRNPDTLQATADAAEVLLLAPGPRRTVETITKQDEFIEPMIDVMSRLLEDDRTVSSVAGFLEATSWRFGLVATFGQEKKI